VGVSSRPIVNFSGGEASPELYGRTDVVPYFACAKTLENVLVTHYGGAFKTPGTKFVNATKASGAVKLIPFIYSTGQSYMLEFGNLYMRIFQNGGSVVEGAKSITGGITQANPGVVTANAHGYSNGDVVDISGVVGMTQVNGRRFIVAGAAANTFQLTDESGNNVNTTSYTAYSSGGSIYRVYQIATPYTTANLSKIRISQQADIMYIDCDGYEPRKLSRFGSTSWTLTTYTYDTFSWPPFLDENATATTLTSTGTTGAVTITASTGIFTAQHVGAYFRMTATGYFKITGYTSATQVSATIIVTLPSAVATAIWAEGAWSDYQGYPQDCKFYENRLYHAATTRKPLNIWGSVIEEYENYQLGTTDEDAVAYQIGSNQVDKILWLYPTQILNLGTAGGPFTASSGSSTAPISPTNISVRQQNENGAANIIPVRIGSYVYYVERSGKVIGQFAYDLNSDSYITDNITYLSTHILSTGVSEMALQKYPYNILWCVLADGTVATLTREQKNEVKGWSRQVFVGTDAVVENVCVIPNGTEDQVWLCVKRTIGGLTKRYIEYVKPHDFGTIENAFFVQSGLTYSGAPATVMTGLEHLNGETVQILADGAVRPDAVVASGSVTLATAASTVHIGLGYTARIETLDIEAGSSTGTAMAKPKLLSKVNVRLKDTVGCSVGTSDSQDIINFRTSADPMDTAIPLFSGDKEVQFPQGWTKEKTVVITQDQPLPLKVLAIYPRILVSD